MISRGVPMQQGPGEITGPFSQTTYTIPRQLVPSRCYGLIGNGPRGI